MIFRVDRYNKRDLLTNRKLGFLGSTACCVWEKLEQNWTAVETQKFKTNLNQEEESFQDRKYKYALILSLFNDPVSTALRSKIT
jgi:hypothetical protein